MLKINLAKRPTFCQPVEFALDDGSGPTAKRFRAEFELLEDTEMDVLTRQHGQPDPDALWSAEGDKALLRRAWTGWEDIVDVDTKQPIAFSRETREYLLSIIPLRTAVVRAYFDGVAGGPRRKN